MTFIDEELEVLERCPDYKQFLKVYIKYQMNTLCQKLADVGEESFVVTASVDEGTFSHVGSSKGDGFLDKLNDIKWKFLTFCSADVLPEAFDYNAHPQEENSFDLNTDPLVKNSVSKGPGDLTYCNQETEYTEMATEYTGQNTEYTAPGPEYPGQETDHATEPHDAGTMEKGGVMYMNYTSNSSKKKRKTFPDDGCEHDGGFPEDLQTTEDTTSQENISTAEFSNSEILPGDILQEQRRSSHTQNLRFRTSMQEESAAFDTNVNTSGKVRLYPCHICSKTFSVSTNLKQHLRMHTGEKPYRCKVCGKGFTTMGNCNQHIRTHTGEKPYQCQFCPKTFSQAYALKAHKLQHCTEASSQ